MDTKFALKYEELGDKTWLRNKYINEKLSLNQIAKIVGCSLGGVRNAIKRNNILLRTKGEGLRNLRRCGQDFFIFDKAVIEGSLLGDAHLSKQNKRSKDSHASFHKGNIHYDHTYFVASKLFSNNFASRIKERNNTYGFYKKHPNSSPVIFRMDSLVHEELGQLFEDWYPESNDYKKIIPRSIEINKEVLLHWFLDDGYSYNYNRKGLPNKKMEVKNYRYLRVQFATQCFNKHDLTMLSQKIYDKFGLKIMPRFHQKHGKISGNGYYMEVSEKQVGLFYEIIGPPPVVSLSYKWKVPGGNYGR